MNMNMNDTHYLPTPLSHLVELGLVVDDWAGEAVSGVLDDARRVDGLGVGAVVWRLREVAVPTSLRCEG